VIGYINSYCQVLLVTEDEFEPGGAAEAVSPQQKLLGREHARIDDMSPKHDNSVADMTIVHPGG